MKIICLLLVWHHTIKLGHIFAKYILKDQVKRLLSTNRKSYNQCHWFHITMRFHWYVLFYTSTNQQTHKHWWSKNYYQILKDKFHITSQRAFPNLLLYLFRSFTKLFCQTQVNKVIIASPASLEGGRITSSQG